MRGKMRKRVGDEEVGPLGFSQSTPTAVAAAIIRTTRNISCCIRLLLFQLSK